MGDGRRMRKGWERYEERMGEVEGKDGRGIEEKSGRRMGEKILEKDVRGWEERVGGKDGMGEKDGRD